jgi:menaquinol-cytochrome c reductase cytochrome b/c subunit
MLVLLLLATGLALWLGTPLEDKADPLTTTYVPRPEWYFYFLFELLWLFPGKWTVAPTFWIPVLGFLVLLALPFVDHGSARSPFRRPVASTAAVVVVAVLLYLTYRGATAPAPPGRVPIAPPRPLSAELERGRQVYEAQGCAACHVIEGAGVPAGPDLSRIGSVRDAEWLRRFVTEPEAVEPRATMLAYKDLPMEDLQALARYLASLK